MNINNNLASHAQNSPIPRTTPQTESQNRFSIGTSQTFKDEADKISISTAAMEMSDTMDPPVPVGAMPSWWGQFAIEVIFLSDLPGWKGEVGSIFDRSGKFSNLSNGETDEYFKLLQSHMDALYERNGLIDDESTYAALNSRFMNEKLHQEFLEGIRNDPKMAEYVSRLGIALS